MPTQTSNQTSPHPIRRLMSFKQFLSKSAADEKLAERKMQLARVLRGHNRPKSRD